MLGMVFGDQALSCSGSSSLSELPREGRDCFSGNCQ